MRCSEAEASSHAYVDGELAGVDRDSYEKHLLECDRCSHASRVLARFKAAVRGHLARRPVPEGLRRRIEGAIASAPPPPRRWRWQLYPRLAPAVLATGALVALVVASRGKQPMALQQAARMFTAQMPMDVVSSSCASIAEWFRGKVDFTVKPPAEGLGARCEGGRLVNVRDRLAAYLTLQGLNGHKLGVMVFDSDEDELEAPYRRVVNGLDIHLVTNRGASTAAFRSGDGLYYVVTGDLDAEALTKYLMTAFPR